MRKILIHEVNAILLRGTALAVILTLSLVLIACGDGASETPTHTPVVPQPEPTSTATPQIEPTSTPAPAPTATPKIEPTPTQTATETPEPTPTENASGGADSEASEPLDIAEHLLQTTSQFWEVYNKYDIDTLKTFYEENYWNEQEAEVQSNMQPFKNFNMSVTPDDPSTPTEIAPGKWEIRQTARFSFGSVKMTFIYEEFDGYWLLTYAEDQ